MPSYTTKTFCPKCNSADCNLTMEELGKAIVADVRKRAIFCNACTYSRVSIIIVNSEVFSEERLPGSDETELEYKYLGQEKF